MNIQDVIKAGTDLQDAAKNIDFLVDAGILPEPCKKCSHSDCNIVRTARKYSKKWDKILKEIKEPQ